MVSVLPVLLQSNHRFAGGAAKSGSGNNGGGGGGGRIAVYSDNSTFSGYMQAFGGVGLQTYHGGPGTLLP